MTPDDFKAWRRHFGYHQQGAADALGISKSTVVNYEAGKRREDGRPVEIPTVVTLAMAAALLGVNEDDARFILKVATGSAQLGADDLQRLKEIDDRSFVRQALAANKKPA